MFTDQLNDLQAAKEHVAKLEMRIAAERKAALAALPAQYGFADVDSFIRALRETASRKRSRIAEAQRDEVKRLLAAGQTGAEISAAVGLSAPSIHAIKRSLGLVKSRGNPAKPASLS